MCKLLATSKLAVRKQKQIVDLTLFSAKALGTTQRDGFGFALYHEKGVYGERYLNPLSCKGMGVITRDFQVFPKGIKFEVRKNRDYDTFGSFPNTDKLNGSYISHGRTATCGKTISNTHPFTGIDAKGGTWTIAHNGVVDNIGKSWECSTTCDSEHILNCFTKGDGVHSLKAQISGYAAVIGINPNGELFAFRDNTAPLYLSYIEDLGICTLATALQDSEEFNKIVCKHNKVKATSITSAYMLDSYTLHTFKSDGSVITEDFAPFDRYTVSASAVSRSMGSAGVPGYSPSGYSPSWKGSSYYDVWDDNPEVGYKPKVKQVELEGIDEALEDEISETRMMLEDPALYEAIKSGSLTVKDLADINGEDPDNEELELLQNQIINKKKREDSFKNCLKIDEVEKKKNESLLIDPSKGDFR